MTPAQRRTLAELHKTGTTAAQPRTMDLLMRKGYIVVHLDGSFLYLTKKGLRIVEGRAGGGLQEVKKKDLRAHFRTKKPARAKRDRATTAKEKKEHFASLEKHLESAERKRKTSLARILGPTGRASAVKIAKADGKPFTAADVEQLRELGWEVTGASSVTARPGTSGIPGVQFSDNDFTFTNPEPIGPNGTARALVIIGPIDAAMVDDLSASGYDVTPAPKAIREGTRRNPEIPKTMDQAIKKKMDYLIREYFSMTYYGKTPEQAWKELEESTTFRGALLAELKRKTIGVSTRNPAEPIQKRVFEALKTSAKRHQALRADELADKLKAPLEAVADALQ
ncbi:MAG: hypothetical protein WCP34_15190, partial [Pseudomonadota bacterium]